MELKDQDFDLILKQNAPFMTSVDFKAEEIKLGESSKGADYIGDSITVQTKQECCLVSLQEGKPWTVQMLNKQLETNFMHYGKELMIIVSDFNAT